MCIIYCQRGHEILALLMIFSSKTGVKHRVQMVEEEKRLFMKSTESSGEQARVFLNVRNRHASRTGEYEEIILRKNKNLKYN